MERKGAREREEEEERKEGPTGVRTSGKRDDGKFKRVQDKMLGLGFPLWFYKKRKAEDEGRKKTI